MNFEGEIIDDFQILEELHDSAPSTIHLAVHIPTNSLCICKIFNISNQSKTATACMIHEITVYLNTDHHSICKCFGLSQNSQIDNENNIHVFLFLEFLSNGSLLAQIEKINGFPENEAKIIFSYIFKAIKYLHEVHFIAHRNLSPDNIFFDSKNEPKIMGFDQAESFYTISKLDPAKYDNNANYETPNETKNINFGEDSKIDNYFGLKNILKKEGNFANKDEERNNNEIENDEKEIYLEIDQPNISSNSSNVCIIATDELNSTEYSDDEDIFMEEENSFANGELTYVVDPEKIDFDTTSFNTHKRKNESTVQFESLERKDLSDKTDSTNKTEINLSSTLPPRPFNNNSNNHNNNNNNNNNNDCNPNNINNNNVVNNPNCSTGNNKNSDSSLAMRMSAPPSSFLRYRLASLPPRGTSFFLRCKMRHFVGTPGYVPPEVIAGEDYSEKCDVWALGVILFQMISARLPFGVQRFSSKELINEIAKLSFPNEFSSDLCDLLAKMLCPDPEARPTLADLAKHPWIEGSENRNSSLSKLPNLYTKAKNNNKNIDNPNNSSFSGSNFINNDDNNNNNNNNNNHNNNHNNFNCNNINSDSNHIISNNSFNANTRSSKIDSNLSSLFGDFSKIICFPKIFDVYQDISKLKRRRIEKFEDIDINVVSECMNYGTIDEKSLIKEIMKGEINSWTNLYCILKCDTIFADQINNQTMNSNPNLAVSKNSHLSNFQALPNNHGHMLSKPKKPFAYGSNPHFGGKKMPPISQQIKLQQTSTLPKLPVISSVHH